MKQFKYQLDKTSKKFICPECGKKRFVRYLDNETENYCDSVYGRCDREINCGYYKIPGGTNSLNNITAPTPTKQPYFIPQKIFQKTLSNFTKNNLYLFLINLFDTRKVQNVFTIYQVGTSKKWEGATIFWQINSKGQHGQGKIMLFNRESGKRIKVPFPHITSVHKQLKKHEQKPEYCFFGEHLISVFQDKPVAIVESEKTALIMSINEPEYLWIASGGLSQLTYKRMVKYKKRKIIFYPDLGAFDKWNLRATELNKKGYRIAVSNLVEQKATINDKYEGFDIADFIVKNSSPGKPQKEVLKKMILENPNLKLLIDRFDLIPI